MSVVRSTQTHRDDRRTDPSRDGRRLVIYFVGLIAVYTAAEIALRPDVVSGDVWALGLMLAPTAGALLARFLGPAVIVWGRPNRWVLAGLLPGVAGLAGYWIAARAGLIAMDDALLMAALVGAVVGIGTACISAAGEEIGWRGFLWPLTRRRLSFIPATLVVTAIWWLYHVPIVIVGWYGSMEGLPAFTVAILGFGAFVGVITERSGGIWASVLAHGTWNALVATSFTAAFTGSEPLMGEFGWIAAISMLILGGASVAWHLATGGGLRRPYPGDTWTSAEPVMAAPA
jgi:membrane protease YdiL (CAAX protease family)